MRHLFIYIKRAAFAAIIGLTATSCADFLEIEPRDIVTEDNFWNEKTDIEQSVAGCYASMQTDAFINRCIVWGELRSDNIYPGDNVENNFYDLYQALRENLLSTNEFTDWSCFYTVINKCNIIIRMAPVVSEKDPSYLESDVRATIAEMTALRSLCYFYLIRAFKDIPFNQTAIQQEDETRSLPATSFDEVLNQLVADLEAVKGDAVARYRVSDSDGYGLGYNSNCNRITRAGINALLCDMYLWTGDYDKAIACAEEVIEQKQADYREFYNGKNGSGQLWPKALTSGDTTIPLFENTQANPSASFQAIFGKGNSYESIFELSFNSTGINDTRYVKNTSLARLYGWGGADKDEKASPVVEVNKGQGFLTVNPAIVSDVTSKTWKFWDHEYDARFYNNVQALSNTYGEGFIRKGVAETFNVKSTGTTYDNYASNSFTTTQQMDRNWIFYRLTDVMLMEAEALLEKVTTEASEENTALRKKAFELMALVNNRSCLDKGKQKSNNFTSVDQMRKFLREERNRELMFEGKRFFDLIRYARRTGSTDIVKSLVPASKASGGASQNNGFPSYEHLFWPYNKNELKVNTLLQQKAIYGSETSDEIEMNK